MAILEIITPENPVLRKKTRKIKDFKDPKLQRLIDNMVETMHDAGGVGLAAPQVAVSQRLLVVQLPDDEESKAEYGEDAGVLFTLINPEIVRTSDDMVEGIEGCLSIQGYMGEVNRYTAVTIKAQDRNGKAIRIKAKDWLARVFQHEIDHLDGILYIDDNRATKIWKVPQTEDGELELVKDNTQEG